MPSALASDNDRWLSALAAMVPDTSARSRSCTSWCFAALLSEGSRLDHISNATDPPGYSDPATRRPSPQAHRRLSGTSKE